MSLPAQPLIVSGSHFELDNDLNSLPPPSLSSQLLSFAPSRGGGGGGGKRGLFSYKENQRLKTRKEGENIALGRWVALENSVSSV